MARLTSKQRNSLPSSTFAGPNRSYPIPDRGHAIAAESMSARYASPSTRAKVLSAVHKKFPDLGHDAMMNEVHSHLTGKRGKK